MLTIAELLEPLRLAERAPPLPQALQSFHAWLRASGSPELATYNEELARSALRAGYRNALFAAQAPTLSDVLGVEDDAARAARIRCVFCGVSPVLEDREDLWFASWGATEEGKSVVFHAHQDERDLWPEAPSLADFILAQYREDSYLAKEIELPPPLGRLVAKTGGAALPPAFDPMLLTERVHWIVALLFPEGDWYGLGNGLVAAPAFERFIEEEASLQGAPHLVAYWLFHHLVFGNQEATKGLAAFGRESAYPAARELASFVDGSLPAWWDARAVERLRAEAQRDRPDVFEPATLRATATIRQEREALREGIRAKLEALPLSAATQLVGAILEGASLDAIDGEVIRSLRADPPGPDDLDRELESLLLSKRGDAPGLGILFAQIAEDVDAPLEALGDDLVALCEAGESTTDRAALAVLLSRKRAAWSDVRERAEMLSANGRVGRLAQAAVALRLGDGEPLAFLRAEARAFFSSLHESATDTAALAAETLLRRRDPEVIAALAEAVGANEPHGGCARALLYMMGAEPAFADVLEAFVARGFGRMAHGEPVLVAAAFARAAPERARAFCGIADADVAERRAAALACGLVADPTNTAIRDAAVALLATLAPGDEREAGAALALLRVAHEAGAAGFAESAGQWQHAKRSRHVGAGLTRWFEANAGGIR